MNILWSKQCFWTKTLKFGKISWEKDIHAEMAKLEAYYPFFKQNVIVLCLNLKNNSNTISNASGGRCSAHKKASFESCTRNFSNARELSGDTLEKCANHLKEKCNNVLIMTGAGLSTPSGIPDFRSPDTGLYYNLKQYNLPYPEAIFDLGFFAKDPRPFLTLAKELYPGEKYHPNLGHHFIHLLHHKGKLLRMYTQNIDGLERLTGIPEERLIEAHGGFSTASCIRCFKEHDPDKTREMILNGEIVYCERSLCKGLVKPDIVFFGEALPDRFSLHEIDTAIADFLIVMGTSLEVYPFASVADAVWKNTPRLLLNRNVVGSFGLREQDAVMTGDIIESIRSLASALDWMDDLEELVKNYENKIMDSRNT